MFNVIISSVVSFLIGGIFGYAFRGREVYMLRELHAALIDEYLKLKASINSKL